AHAARLAPPVRRGSRGGGRRRRRLRIRSGVQPRVQEARGAGSRHVAKSHDTCRDQPPPLRYKVKSAHKQRIFLAASLPVFLIASSQATAQTKVTRSPAVPSAVRAACDMAFAIAKATPGVSIRRSTGTFRDETLRMPMFGC